MYKPNYLEELNKNMFPHKKIGCGRIHISKAKEGDTIIFTGGIMKSSGKIIATRSFTLGAEYILSRDYSPANETDIAYFISVDGDKDEKGHVSILADDNKSPNGWNAALFKLKNKD